jgi:hypothetical protein
MTVILPYPLAIGASKLNHANTIAINTIYQNLSIFVSIFALNLLNIEPQLFFYIENPDDRENGLWIHTA